MRIKKTSGTAVLNGNIIDSLDDNSTTNAPSQRAVNERFTYSTEEQKIGIWLGKPLYRKVLNLGNLNGEGNAEYNTGLTNVALLKKIEGSSLLENTYGIKLPTNGDAIDGVIFRAKLSSEYSKLSTERTNNSFYNTIFIIEYTKTTD